MPSSFPRAWTFLTSLLLTVLLYLVHPVFHKPDPPNLSTQRSSSPSFGEIAPPNA